MRLSVTIGNVKEHLVISLTNTCESKYGCFGTYFFKSLKKIHYIFFSFNYINLFQL